MIGIHRFALKEQNALLITMLFGRFYKRHMR